MKRVLLFFMFAFCCLNYGCSQETSIAKSDLASQIENQEVADLIAQNAERFPEIKSELEIIKFQ